MRITRLCDAELLDAHNRFHSHMKMFINGREAVYLEEQFDTSYEAQMTKWISSLQWVAARMQKIVREMRGIPFFLLREYLEEMGGTAVSDDQVQGPGWSVKLDPHGTVPARFVVRWTDPSGDRHRRSSGR